MFSKNIVIYGCDNSGKTTAAKEIKEILHRNRISCDVIHSCGPLSAQEQLQFMIDNLNPHKFDQMVKVFDRFPAIEETIYGPIVRGNDKLKNYKITCTELLKKVDLFIYCNPPSETIKSWGRRIQMDGVKENADKIIFGYETITNKFPVIKENLEEYDWTKRNEKSLYDILISKGIVL